MIDIASGLNKGVTRSDELPLDFREFAHQAWHEFHQLSCVAAEFGTEPPASCSARRRSTAPAVWWSCAISVSVRPLMVFCGSTFCLLAEVAEAGVPFLPAFRAVASTLDFDAGLWA